MSLSIISEHMGQEIPYSTASTKSEEKNVKLLPSEYTVKIGFNCELLFQKIICS